MIHAPSSFHDSCTLLSYTFGLCLISWEGLYGKEIDESVRKSPSSCLQKIREIGMLNLSAVLTWQVSLLTATPASSFHNSCSLFLSRFMYPLPFMVHVPTSFHDSFSISLSWFMYHLPFLIHVTSPFLSYSWFMYTLTSWFMYPLPYVIHVPSPFHHSCNLSLTPLLVIHVHSPFHESCTLSLSWFILYTLSLSWFIYPLHFMIHVPNILWKL